MTIVNEVTRKGDIGPDICPAQKQNAVAELRACKGSDQPGDVPEKGRRLTPAARKNTDADSMKRLYRCGERVKVSVIHVDKQEAVSQTIRRDTPASLTGCLTASCRLTSKQGTAS